MATYGNGSIKIQSAVSVSALATVSYSVPVGSYAIVTVGTSGGSMQIAIGFTSFNGIPSGSSQFPVTGIYVGPGQTITVSTAAGICNINGVQFYNAP